MPNKKTNKPADAKTEVVAAPAVEVKEVKKAEAAPVQEVKKEEVKPAAEKKAVSKTEKKTASKPAAKKASAKAEKKAAPKAEKKAAPKAEKKAAPKTAAKKADGKGNKLIIEIGKGYDSAEIIEMCRADYKEKNPRKQIRSLKVYVNVAESKAYYVVNENSDTNSVELA